ncbi:hypothetical protein WMY93_003271 [Mugilogobius chulae]|uniref:Uncharacterized protein n=1 Tax=Mugilogobius chulae TaxID=88201 RepID=A0AAW0PXS3_9GOBI
MSPWRSCSSDSVTSKEVQFEPLKMAKSSTVLMTFKNNRVDSPAPTAAGQRSDQRSESRNFSRGRSRQKHG